MEKILINIKKGLFIFWNYIRRYRNLKEPLMIDMIGDFVRRYVGLVYLAGLVVFIICVFSAFTEFPHIFLITFELVVICIFFAIFRLLCEILSTEKTSVLSNEVKSPKKTVRKKKTTQK